MNAKTKIVVIVGLVILALVISYYYENIKSWVMIKKLGLQQQGFINSLNPQAKLLFTNFIHAVENQTGYKVFITDAYRTFLEQQALKDSNPLNASAGYSMHNYGLAIDINGVDENGIFILKKSTSKQEWIDSGIPAIASQYGLFWGGDFNSYHDPIHFDLRNNYDIAYLQNLAEATYGNNPENVKGNELQLVA